MYDKRYWNTTKNNDVWRLYLTIVIKDNQNNTNVQNVHNWTKTTFNNNNNEKKKIQRSTRTACRGRNRAYHNSAVPPLGNQPIGTATPRARGARLLAVLDKIDMYKKAKMQNAKSVRVKFDRTAEPTRNGVQRQLQRHLQRVLDCTTIDMYWLDKNVP